MDCPHFSAYRQKCKPQLLRIRQVYGIVIVQFDRYMGLAATISTPVPASRFSREKMILYRIWPSQKALRKYAKCTIFLFQAYEIWQNCVCEQILTCRMKKFVVRLNKSIACAWENESLKCTNGTSVRHRGRVVLCACRLLIFCTLSTGGAGTRPEWQNSGKF